MCTDSDRVSDDKYKKEKKNVGDDDGDDDDSFHSAQYVLVRLTNQFRYLSGASYIYVYTVF